MKEEFKDDVLPLSKNIVFVGGSLNDSMMTNRDKLKRRVVELMHNLPYDEAVQKELNIPGCLCEHKEGWKFEVFAISESGKRVFYNQNSTVLRSCCQPLGLPITLSRVMQALRNKYGSHMPIMLMSSWTVLTTETGETATDDDQTEECIGKLLLLLV